MADKDVAGVVGGGGRAPGRWRGATIIATSLPVPRALAGRGPRRRPGAPRAPARPCASSRTRRAALDLALDTARGPVVVAGSLYLVGDARARLVDDPALRDPVMH